MSTTRTRGPQSGRGSTSPGRLGNRYGGRGGGNGRTRRPKRRGGGFWRLVGQTLGIVVILALLGGLFFLGILSKAVSNLASSVPEIENFKPYGRTVIYSTDGTVLANIFQQNRQAVSIDQIPLDLQHATVAIEDERFYTNKGVDVRGIGRALYRDITKGKAGEGGSTITQQLVRNLGIDGVGRQKTLERKIKEALLALQIEKNFSKQQILEMYLNQVYYGSGSYGVQTASQTYFGQNVAQLDLAQCALLAGLPKAPSLYSPYVDPESSMNRRNTVLYRMLELHYITSDQYQTAHDEPVKLVSSKPPSSGSHIFHAPFFVDYIVQQLSNKYGADFVYQGGIKVYSTLNWNMQQAAEKAAIAGIQAEAYTGANQCALVAMEPKTGYIRAMVGGVDYHSSQFNIAANGRRQPGSSFKPIIYTAALDCGLIKEDTPILDEPISFPGATGTWSPKNDDGVFHGWVTAKRAVADSINVPAVKVLKMVGVDTALEYAKMMGVKSPLAPYLTLALGASSVTPLEMADVYSVIANQGQRPEPLGVMQITDDDGNVIESDAPQLETTTISSDALAHMGDMLRSVVTGGTASATFRDDQPPDAHGKTGTTQNHRDVWFDGYCGDKMVCIVWAGHPVYGSRGQRADYGLPMSHEAFGATICAPIWKNFMVQALAIQAREAALDAQKHAAGPPASPNAPSGGSNASGNSDSGNAGANPSNSSNNGTGANGNSAGNGDNEGAGSTDSGTNSGDQTPGDNGSNAPNGSDNGSNGGAQSPQPSGAGTPSASPSHPGNQQTLAAPAKPRTVTVTICAESGLLATKWCPETIERTFPAGKEPRRYCDIHAAPPGEQ